MLRELRIKDFTIVDDLTITFEPGFNVLTGETGAGKSIIVDALGLLLGERASMDLIRAGRREARIEAFFDFASIPQLDELGIDCTEGIILRRSLAAQGKGRAYVNDSPVALTTLAGIGRALVDIHGQHEHQGLLKKETHLGFVDTLGGLLREAERFRAEYDAVAELRERVRQLSARMRERTQRLEFLRYQLAEIDAAGLRAGEKESLEEERAIQANLARLREASEGAYDLLYGAEGSVVERLSKAGSLAADLARFDRNADEVNSLLESALPLVEDAASALRRLRDGYEADPGRLEVIDDRLELIRRLEKKYGEGIEGILAHRETASGEASTMEHADEQNEAWEKELSEKEQGLRTEADELSKKRHQAAARLEKAVVRELHELGFQKVRFVVSLNKLSDPGPAGADDGEFLFSANPGEPPRPLAKIASGGELSRIMLALKCLEIAGTGDVSVPAPPRTLVFDEVDAGIGGATARQVGQRLHDLAPAYQVFCITHLPQIAARAGHHLKVDKALSAKDVRVSVAALDRTGRREELARMLSGSVTDRSLSHAEELLDVDKTP